MKIGILGGSFDPIHLGHILSAAWALATQNLDEVWLTPCFKHGGGKELSSFLHRYSMCVEGTQGFKSISVSAIEHDLGVNYSFDMLQGLLEQYPEHSFVLLLGEDLRPQVDSWYKGQELFALCRVAWMPRGGHLPESEFNLPQLSSSFVREQIAKRECVKQYLPRGVWDYIEAHQLYSAT